MHEVTLPRPSWLRTCLVLLLAVLGLPLSGRAAEGDSERLRQEVLALGNLTKPPATHPVEGGSAEGGLRSFFYEGLPYRGKPTRVFAWYGLPEKRAGKVPAVVLVHGGGGTAFPEWVRRWNTHGFAALAIAVEGQTDQRAADPKTWRGHAWPGPARQGIYGDSALPLADQWMYHAVADVVLAHSLLRSFPEVDAKRIGVVGISWGGVITTTVAGIDRRFAFAIPIYGCGFLHQAENQYGRALQDHRLYQEVWEPGLRLPRAAMPMFWLTWLRDPHFPLDALRASYRAARGPRMIAVLPDMGHSHPAGWVPEDSYAFAEAVVRDGQPWLRELGQRREGGRAFAEWQSVRNVDRAGLLATADTGYTGKRRWTEGTARLDQKDGRVCVSAALPPGTRAYFFNLHCGKLTASSEWREVVAEK